MANPRGVRLNRRHQDMVRDKIRVSHLIRRLQDHADGKISLDNAQIRSINILLDKSLPSLTAQEIQATVTDNNTESMSDGALLALIEGGKGK